MLLLYGRIWEWRKCGEALDHYDVVVENRKDDTLKSLARHPRPADGLGTR